MANGPVDMSRKEFSVAYDGPLKEFDHSIDVDTLAPALLAFGRLIREANKEFNGKSATAKVFVVSDFEHKCFNINFEVVLTAFEQLKSLIGTQDAKDAKEILEWLGLLSVAPISVVTFLGFLRWRRGRQISQTTVTDTEKSGIVRVTVEGDDNHVEIHQHVYNLAQNPKALEAARDAFAPVGTHGFDRMEFRDDEKTFEPLTEEDTEAIIASCRAGLDDAQVIAPDVDVTTAWLTVYSPVYDLAAGQWRFKHGKEIILADISATSIGDDAMARGGALRDDTYQVKIEITVGKTADGKTKKPSHRILEVLRFIPAEPTGQPDLFEKLEGPTDDNPA